jgi:hypothetical protein
VPSSVVGGITAFTYLNVVSPHFHNGDCSTVSDSLKGDGLNVVSPHFYNRGSTVGDSLRGDGLQ